MTVLGDPAQRARFGAAREALAGSQLVRHGGVLVTRMLDPGRLAALLADAQRAHPNGSEARVEPLAAERRGDPERWLESAPGGAALQELAGDRRVLMLLSRATGALWEPAGPGSWSYYRRAGHYLGLHRDLAVCDLAVITCVLNIADAGDDPRETQGATPAGALRVWPTRTAEPLEELRRDEHGGVDLDTRAGDTVLLLGGLVAHRVLPTAPGQVRVVAPLCYRLVGS